MYNLANLGASLPRDMQIVTLLDADFAINPSAPKYEGPREQGVDKISQQEAIRLTENCRLIGAHVESGDQEIWFLTQAGEIVRATGEGTDVKFYVVETSEAPFYLDSYADEEALAVLEKLGLYEKTASPSI
jgi:hypothetical protein